MKPKQVCVCLLAWAAAFMVAGQAPETESEQGASCIE